MGGWQDTDPLAATLAGSRPPSASGKAPPGYGAADEHPTAGELLVRRELDLERQEHLASVARLRELMPLAMVLWMGFLGVDWVVATWVEPAAYLPYVAVRLLGLLPIAATYALLHRPVSPRALAIIDGCNQACIAGLLTSLCLLSNGIVSPYSSYIPLVLMGRAAVLPAHWKRGAVHLAIPALMYPAVLGTAAPFMPRIAAQFADPSARGTFIVFVMLIFGAWLLLVIGGHNVWKLRRQVFESRSIGRYRLRHRIGAGGMGEVWLAFHERLERDVALKLLRPEQGTDPLAIARFEREIKATAELAHPNTIRLYEHGVTEDGIWYYAMEYLTGSSLADLVKREGPLEPHRAVHIIGQATRALAEAHRRTIVHRDIKPENIFVTTLGGESDFVKLLDFGIAAMERPDDTKLTATGSMAGTPAYISPEAALGKSVGPRADVYALGASLYFALTGRPPFSGPTAMAMVMAHVSEPPVAPSIARGEPLPEALDRLVVRCLDKDPEARPTDAGELASLLPDTLH